MTKKKTILFFGLLMIKTQNKYYEPSGANVYLKYICPNGDCLDVQWVTLKESQTKNYRIVCDCCGKVYRPKRIKNVLFEFYDEQIKKTQNKEKTQTENFDFLQDAKATLIKFGFTKDEADNMIENEFKKSGSNNPATLVKNALDFFGVNNG